MATTIERLEELLVAKDQELARVRADAEAELATVKAQLEEYRLDMEEAQMTARKAKEGWAVPRVVRKDPHPELPIPRLEFEQSGDSYTVEVEYRLVRPHFIQGVVIMPLGRTTIQGHYGPEGRDPTEIPFRDGAHAAFDSTVFGLPVYAITPEGPKELDLMATHPAQCRMGRDERRVKGY